MRPSKQFIGLQIRRAAMPALALGGGFAILIWAKLRMVTGLPRSVYADPPIAPAPTAQPKVPPHATSPARPAADAQIPREPDHK